MKKLTAFLVSIIMGMTCITANAEINTIKYEQYATDGGEYQRIIVEVEGDAVLASEKARKLGTDYLDTASAKSDKTRIRNNQNAVLKNINNAVDTDIKTEYTYSLIFNGFSAEVPTDKIEEIKKLPGVKNVYISEKMELRLSDSTDMIDSLPQDTATDDNTGYTGDGQAVAIIDSEFQTDHDFFSQELTNPYITKQELEAIKNENATLQGSYISTKIPYAYDYGEHDNNLFNDNKNVIHGTHVAGIAAGASADKGMSGVAPDAQLVLMKVSDRNGALNSDAIIKAMEDAVLLNVCAINMSFGATYASPLNSDPYYEAINNAVSAGIMVNVSAGNSGIGYENSYIYVNMPDYGASGTPDSFSNATSVAAMNKPNEDGISVAWYSSWGVNETLELKPEISAPGTAIESSLPSAATDYYGQKSGTSMAAPHMTGVTALMNEYFDDNGIDVSGQARVQRIENTLMSSAKIIYQPNSTIPYSPRVQGSGLVNVSAAVKTPVIIEGDTGKTKLSLREIDNTFTLKCTLQNLTDEDVTYDNISLDVIADNCGTDTETGEIYVIGVSRVLNYTCDLPEAITVPANSTAVFEETVTLDEAQLEKDLQIFQNGFFVDGFVKFSNDTNPEISIPFTGFYGDWTKATVFDKTMYDEGGSALNGEWDITMNGTYLYTMIGNSITVCGQNSDKVFNENRISISPNKDGKGDYLGINISPLRAIQGMTVLLQNNNRPSKGIEIDGSNLFLNKYYKSRLMIIHSGNSQYINTNNLPDGEYTLTVTANFPYEGDTPDTLTLPVTVDREKPVITDVTESENVLTVKAKDTNYIKDAVVRYTDEAGAVKTEKFLFDEDKGQEVSVDFTIPDGADRDSIYITIEDDAYNSIRVEYRNTGRFVGYLKNNSVTSEAVTMSYVNILNTGDSSVNSDVILAYYDNDGLLINTIKKPDITIEAGETKELEFKEFINTAGTEYIKMFIWQSGNIPVPLDNFKTFTAVSGQ